MKVFDDFKFKKIFGQNFISDKNLLNAVVSDSGISSADEVLEIGTGAGTLTTAIAQKAKKVVSYEIDKNLTEYLQDKFKENPKVTLICADALKEDISEIEKHFSNDYHIIANIPYYITSPLIFKFLEQTDKIKSITVMVQKEVAQKATAKPKDENYGVLSVMLQYYCNPKITRIVKKKMFTPPPKVDSAILRLEKKPNIKFDKKFKDFVFGIFAMKRKTLNNNLLKLGHEKEQINNALQKLGFNPNIRSEELTFQQIRQLFEILNK